MLLKRIAAPVSLPVTLEQAKLWLRVSSDDELDTIDALIRAAAEKLDGAAGCLNPSRALAPQTWEAQLDGFPSGSVALPIVPVTAIVSVKYTDGDGAEQTVDPATYALQGDEWSASLTLATDASWPATGSGTATARIRFTAGYAQLPAALKQDVLTLVGWWFDNRDKVGQLPPGWSSPYRRLVFA
jgi:uncharacterized phiE125 gp8 family phage protein